MKKIALYFICLGFLTSCQKEVRVYTYAEQPAQGGADSGGSNEYMGKPIESYAVDVTSFPEYQEVVLPILNKLNEIHPRFAKLLKKSSLSGRTWYLVPGSLKKIPNATISFPFLNETEQYALHTEKSIWLSSEKREQSSNLQIKGLHILHEMVMAVMVDGNKRDRQLTSSTFITEKEYDQIRGLVFILNNQLDTLSTAALSDYLKKNGFYRGFLNFELVRFKKAPSKLFKVFDGTRAKITMNSAEEFFNLLDSNPDVIPNKDTDTNYCNYRIDDYQQLTMDLYNHAGSPVNKTDLKGSDDFLTWVTEGRVDFNQISSQAEYLGVRTATWVNEFSFCDFAGYNHANAITLSYIKNELVFFQVYKAYQHHSYTNGAWKNKNLKDGYILCVNRNLQP